MDFVFKAFFLQFLLFGMLVHVVRPQTGGTDCRGKDYLCLDDVRFQLCVDYGDGQPKTVTDEVQLCPQGTFCSNSGHLECDSFVPPSTTAEPHVNVDESATEAVVVVEEVPEETEAEASSNEPSTEANNGDDGATVVPVEVEVVEVEVTEENATGLPTEVPSSSPAEVTTNEVPAVPSEGTQLPEESDAGTTVQEESDPETTTVVVEQATEEASPSSLAPEVDESESDVETNPTTPSSPVEPTTQSSNDENTEAPVDSSTVSVPEETNQPEEEATSVPEASTAAEETSPDGAAEQEPVQTEAPEGEVTEDASPSVVPEDTEAPAATTEEASEVASTSAPEESVPTTVVPEVEATTEEEAATEESSQPEQSTDEVPTTSVATETEAVESEAPQTSSATPDASETTDVSATETVVPEATESSSASSEPAETTPAVTVTEATTAEPPTSSVAAESTPSDSGTNGSSSDEGEAPGSSSSQDSTEVPPAGSGSSESNEASTAAPETPVGPFACQTAGRFAHPTDCHKYYLCFWLPFGLYSLEQNCMPGFAYNPTMERCTADQSACFPGQFTCTAAGRFADPADPTHYFWCVWNMFSGYVQYNLQCPLGQVFNPFRGRCAFVTAGRALSMEPLEGEEPTLYEELPEESTTLADQPTEPAQPVEPVAPVEVDQPKLKVKFQCLEEGTFADPNNCGRYFVCTLKKVDKFKKSKFKCVTGERFDADTGMCVPDLDALCA